MAHITFVIPQSIKELLSESRDRYFVRDVVTKKEFDGALKNTKQLLKDEGPEYIIENFDVYYSILHEADNLHMNTIHLAYQQLHQASKDLVKILANLLEDVDSLSDEQKVKYQNVIKMLLYVYINMVELIENKNEMERERSMTKGKKRKNDNEDTYSCDRRAVLFHLNSVMQQDIKVLWDPPVVDEIFVNKVSEICYKLLELPKIYLDKESLPEIWNLLGLLIKNYNHGMAFVVRLVQLIKMKEHLLQVVPAGMNQLVSQYHCKSLLRDFIREMTEWQTDDRFTDSQGARFCSHVLTEMALLMPSLLLPEMEYLTDYLSHEPYSLRISVINILTEIILKVFVKDTLSEEELLARTDFFQLLEDHIMDINSFVRTAVFKCWSKLQVENAIPKDIQVTILVEAVAHLFDKAASVRKNAAICVRTFLEHNIYSADLKNTNLKKELANEKERQKKLVAKLKGIDLPQIEDQWIKNEVEIKAIIKDKLKTENIYINEEADEIDLAEIKTHLDAGNFDKAVSLALHSILNQDFYKQTKSQMNVEQKTCVILASIRSLVVDCMTEIYLDVDYRANATPEELEDLTKLENTILFLQNAVRFTEVVDSARRPMKDLLESVTVGDMHEAVAFFTVAYKFNIDGASDDVLDMLKVMQRNDNDRQAVILGALKEIYLTTDAKTMEEHAITVVGRLIGLVKSVSYQSYGDLRKVFVEWATSGTLDNSIIDMLWKYFTKKVAVSDDDSRAALIILTMAASGRSSIAHKNIRLVSTVAFTEPRCADFRLVTVACELLRIAGSEQQLITDTKAPFRVKNNEEMWEQLLGLLTQNFTAKQPFFNKLISAAIELIYRLASQPIKLCNQLVKTIIGKLSREYKSGQVPRDIIIYCCTLLGQIAICHLNYLDHNVYKEIKRRNNIREMKQSNNKRDVTNTSCMSATTNPNTTQNNIDDGSLEGAHAFDRDSDFIIRVLEKTVLAGNCLGQLGHIITNVCTQPTTYNDLLLQSAASTALIRYMLVSNVFCEKYATIVFKMLEKTTFEDVKVNILIHISDLLERFPNDIEPYIGKVFQLLHSDCKKVKRSTLFVLANLILRDMIRPEGNIAKLAFCIKDKDDEIQAMAKNFFVQLASKTTNLYSVLPDIFSHLCEQIDEEVLQNIMEFLFGLIDKNKQLETLVSRFCFKYSLTDDEVMQRKISHCLTLITYNEKGLQKLIDNFPVYKHILLVGSIYKHFKKIIASCSKDMHKKKGMPELVEQLQKLYESVFATHEGGEPDTNTSRGEKRTSRKKRQPKRKNEQRKRKSRKDESTANSSSDSSD